MRRADQPRSFPGRMGLRKKRLPFDNYRMMLPGHRTSSACARLTGKVSKKGPFGARSRGRMRETCQWYRSYKPRKAYRFGSIYRFMLRILLPLVTDGPAV